MNVFIISDLKDTVLYSNGTHVLRHFIDFDDDTDVTFTTKFENITAVDFEFSENSCIYFADNKKKSIQVRKIYTD